MSRVIIGFKLGFLVTVKTVSDPVMCQDYPEEITLLRGAVRRITFALDTNF